MPSVNTPTPKFRLVRSEMRRDEAFENILSSVWHHDAEKLESKLDTIAQRIVHEGNILERRGRSSDLIKDHIAKRKREAMEILRPGDCQVCLESGNETNRLIRPCGKATTAADREHWYHMSCLRELFLAAAKDEGSTPPKCCGIPIADAFGFELLSEDEFQAYKDKCEEKESTNRTYCPSLECSHFIPKRIIEQAIDERVKAVKQLTIKPIGYVRGSFKCPQCGLSICLTCKRRAHPEEDCRGADDSGEAGE
ncbi:MAG: hypothetical protein Q9179_005237 [Wetmoreana sp. 5 TL-2023]